MRTMSVGALFLILASCAPAQSPSPRQSADARDLQTAFCPRTHPLEVTPSEKFFLDGSIGKRHVRMYLDRGGSGVVGLFFDIGGDWQITQLGGTWNNGAVDVSDGAENHPATGQLKANFADARLTGFWIPATGSQPEPVDLATIPEPRCDGNEKWKDFEDPNTKISIAYPASWRLDKDRDGIWLTCPDPHEIAYSYSVLIKMGAGTFKSPPDLLQCNHKWVYGASGSDCDCDHPDKNGCHATDEIHRGSAIILNVGEHEWRTYCHDGGYVGQGDGEDRIILLPHSWVEIMADGKSADLINRLVDSVKERPTSQSR